MSPGSPQPSRAGDPAPSPRQLRSRHLLLLLALSFALLSLSFPPYVRSDGFPIWVALVPMLFAARLTDYRRLALASWLLGWVAGAVSVLWLRHVSFAALLSLAFYLSFYPLVFVTGWKLLDRRFGWPAALSVPLLWVSLEYVRSFLLTGFPWFYLGHSLYQNLPLIQIADLAGAYAVSVLVAAVNGVAADALWLLLFRSSKEEGRRRALKKVVASAVAVALAVAATGLYGYVRLGRVRVIGGPKVALIQGNIPQSLKFKPMESQKIFSIHQELSLRAASEDPDLIIWPETMLPGVFDGSYFMTLDRSFDLDSSVRQMMAELDRPLLAGVRTESALGDQFNSALLLDASGRVVATYSKAHLVPFGEFVPRIVRAPLELLPEKLNPIPYRFGLEAGRTQTIFELRPRNRPEAKPLRFGVLICYEDIMPYLARGLARRGVDCLVNITNDGWFKDSSELDQHVIGSVFRAVETRRPVLRVANTGITSIISPRGEEVARLRDPVSGEDREVPGFLLWEVPLSQPRGQTIYVQWGDRPLQVAAAAALLLLVFAAEGAWRERKTAKSGFFD